MRAAPREERELQPGLVVLEGGEGQVADAGLLGAADRVLAAGAAAVAQLQGGDVGVVLVGDEGGMAVPLGVEDFELGAGVGTLAADDQPGALRPGGEVDVIAQLDDPGTIATRAVGFNRALPCRFGRGEDRLADPCIDLVADREADTGVAAVLCEGVGAAADVGTGQDLAAEVCSGQLLEGCL
jgi:hypothetical protein